MTVIDYDDLQAWGPLVGGAVMKVAPPGTLPELQSLDLEFMEDAGEFVMERVGREALVEHLSRSLSGHLVRVYHGTRLTETEAERIRVEGLQPLRLVERRDALAAIFGQHERWSECKCRFDAVLHDLGHGERAGRREDGCVHVCFSRAGLFRGCNHYLTHGAEVDGHVAFNLFGDASGYPLLQRNRRAKLITFLSPFPEAAAAADPHGPPDTGLPSLLGLLLQAWAYKEANPGFKVASQKDCTAARFHGVIGAHRIEVIQGIQDVELGI